jgi:hypothetical protein
MSALASLAAILLLAGSPGETSQSDSAVDSVEQTVRPPHELRKAVHAALKHSAPLSNPDLYEVTPELLSVYEELQRDTQIEEFDRKRLRGLVRGRLEGIVRQLEKEAEPLSRRPQAPRQPKDVQARGDVLAQQGLPVQGAPGAAPNAGGNIGPGQGGLPDNGPMLVDLIKRTIAPNTWDDLGGPGTIYYYRPLRVLVIRQTGEVHEKVGGVLGGLRAGQ